MTLIVASSLAETVEAVNEAWFEGRCVAADERLAAARWIAARQGLPGSYAGSFALLPDEARQGVRLFTGERATNAGARHILGQEACRVLRLMKVRDRAVDAALATATSNLDARIGPVRPPSGAGGGAGGSSHWWEPYLGGVYCCGRCSVGYWRHLSVGGFDDQERRLAVGLRWLKECRKGNGKSQSNGRAPGLWGWRVFPFWYTLSALMEMDLPAAADEIRYVAPQLERVVRRVPRDDRYAQRRHELAQRALARI
ncbi:MAG: hypothetical protein WD042_15265 [Phycisphaeraceae bacterium]